MHNLTELLQSINNLSPDDVAAFLAFVKAYKQSGATRILQVNRIESGNTVVFLCLADNQTINHKNN